MRDRREYAGASLSELTMQSPRFIMVSLLAAGLVIPPVAVAAQSTPPAPDALDSGVQPSSPGKQSLQARIAELSQSGKYDELERIANKLRVDQTRMAGGGWQITRVYAGLEARPGTLEEDHIAQLNAWIAARPQSITAHVALAEAYIHFAWMARGNGLADTVTTEGWRLFAARIGEAKRTLDDSANLTPMCPGWYSTMMTVGLAQDWDKPRMAALFDQAIQFEPNYFHFYQSYARYLLPKWDGEIGEDAAFAKRSGDALGGAQGDFVYYQIAIMVLGLSNGKVDTEHMDWARIQRGYQAQGQLYSNTNYDTNRMALMAWRFRDVAAARAYFDQVGQKWDKQVWKTRERFDKSRDWAMENHGSTAAPQL